MKIMQILLFIQLLPASRIVIHHGHTQSSLLAQQRVFSLADVEDAAKLKQDHMADLTVIQ